MIQLVNFMVDINIMSNHCFHQFISLVSWILLINSQLFSIAYAAEKDNSASKAIENEISLVIDVSGSMKKTDPKNIRSPALRLMVNLLPENTHAGVWTFGSKVNQLVNTANTDAQWKDKARKASNKIHSKDLFTHIGEALQAASAHWQVSSAEQQTALPAARNLIILTDGMVDISKDNQANATERKKILEQLLPQLKAKKMQIHTVALSELADKDFLQQLSMQTDGSFTKLDKADELERVFLHLFEKTTEQETIPLINNNFSVDDSIYELTLLVFKDKTAENQTTQLILPNSKYYTLRNHPSNVRWFAEENYDLITIQKPNIGDWSINASIDPDNRVMVLSNLKIDTNRIPNNVFLGEHLPLQVSLSDENEHIVDDDFLSMTSLSVSRENADPEKRSRKKYLHDNGLKEDKQANDGKFDTLLTDNNEIGKNKYNIVVKGETFARQLRKSYYVHDIALLNSSLSIVDKDGEHIKRVVISPNLEYMSIEDIHIAARLHDKETDKYSDITLVKEKQNAAEWYFETNSLDPDADYAIELYMQGKTRQGRPVQYMPPPIKLNINQVLAKNDYSESKQDNIKVTVEPGDEAQDSKAEENETEQAAEEDLTEDEELPVVEEEDWMSGIIIAVVVNIIAIIAGWFFYRRWKKNQEQDLINFTGEAI